VFARLVKAFDELFAQLRSPGVDDGHTLQLQSQEGGPAADGFFLAEQGQIDHLAGTKDLGGLENALLAALGQDDVLAVGPGPLEERILEHQRRHGGGHGLNHLLFQAGGVDMALEDAERPGYFLLVVRPQRAPDLAGPEGGGVGVAGHEINRQGEVIESIEQPDHGGARLQAAGEEHAGRRGVVARGDGSQGGKNNVGPITGVTTRSSSSRKSM
jgi:hypothetical protein